MLILRDMAKKDYKYLQFPLCLLQEIIRDRKKGLELCINYGFGHYAMSQKVDIAVVVRQVIYAYYRQPEELPRDLRTLLHEAENEGQFSWDDDYNGFDGNGNFDPSINENTKEVTKLLEDNPDLKEIATDYCKWHGAELYFKGHIKIHNLKGTIKGYYEAKGIQLAYETKYGPDAMPSIKPSTLFEFRDEPKSDICILLAYVGIKSLIGHRQFISSSKPVILSRMIGAKSKQSFEAFSQNEGSREIIERYSKRWPMDRLLLSLAEQKFIMYLTKPHVSVVYISTYMEPDELAALVKQSQAKRSLMDKIKKASQEI